MRRVIRMGRGRLVLKILATSLPVGLLVAFALLSRPGAGHATPGLTAEEARRALVELLRESPTAFQRTFPSDELAKQPLIKRGLGRYRCGDFRISLPDSTYRITVTYGCVFEYEGTFRFERQRWIASQPHWTSASLVEGPRRSNGTLLGALRAPRRAPRPSRCSQSTLHGENAGRSRLLIS